MRSWIVAHGFGGSHGSFGTFGTLGTREAGIGNLERLTDVRTRDSKLETNWERKHGPDRTLGDLLAAAALSCRPGSKIRIALAGGPLLPTPANSFPYHKYIQWLGDVGLSCLPVFVRSFVRSFVCLFVRALYLLNLGPFSLWPFLVGSRLGRCRILGDAGYSDTLILLHLYALPCQDVSIPSCSPGLVCMHYA